MDFYAVLDQVVALLRQRQRVTYRARERFGRPLYPAVMARLHLATCLSALGEFRQALSTAEEGLQVAETLQLGEIAMQFESLHAEETATHYRQALILAEDLGMRPLQAHCHRGLGTLYTKIGWREQAPAALSVAIALYRAMDMTFWLPQAEAALAQAEER